MYTRFKDSLITPSLIVKYLKDKTSVIISYFLILVIIITLPIVIYEVSYTGLSSSQINKLTNEFTNNISGPYEIIDNKLEIDPVYYDLVKYLELDYYTIGIINTPSGFMDYYFRVVFTENGVNYSSLVGNTNKTYSFNELGLNNFDFNNYSNANIERFVKGLNIVIKDNQAQYKMMMVLGSFIANGFELLILALIIALFNRHIMPYKLKFKLSIYAISIYTVLSFFGVIFNLNILNFVGIIMASIYLRKATQKIMVL
ncbi:MAG: DUF1189 family protein [Acholeplasmataceae bacterium]